MPRKFPSESQSLSCISFSGVRFRFQYDYNGGAVNYTTKHAYELPAHVTNSARSEHTSNLMKHGISGVPLIAGHVIFLHHSNVHIIDLSVLTASPGLRRCFERMSPLNALYISKSMGDVSFKFGDFPGNALTIALEVARRHSPPPWSVFGATQIGHPTMRIAETCRVCKRVEREGRVKLSICTKCLQEERPYRAVYCSRECLSADWKERHKAEHAGEREWDVEGVRP